MAEKQDIRENQMPAGTPVKLRALDASGNSITVTPTALAVTGSYLQRGYLYGNALKISYSKIATFNAPSGGEGGDYSLTLLISGGNLYTSTVAVTILSTTVHRGGVRAAKSSLVGSIEIGYVYANDTLSVWVKRVQFTHKLNVSVLSERGNGVLVSNETLDSPPAGYTIVGG